MSMESAEEDGEGPVKHTGKAQRNFFLSVTICFDSVIIGCYWGMVEPLEGKA